MTLFFVLPAYNEERRLGDLLASFQKDVADNCAVHVVVVDDGSSDTTARTAQQFADRMSLEVIIHPANRGLGETIRDGLQRACELAQDEDVIVTMDADFTHPTSLIPAMVEKLDEGYDLVIASRFRKGSEVRGLSVKRRMMTQGARFLFQFRFPIPGVRDYTCGFRAYRARTVKAAFEKFNDDLVSERSFACMAEILVKMGSMGIRVAEVPFILRYDLKEGASKAPLMWTIRRSLRMLAVRGSRR